MEAITISYKNEPPIKLPIENNSLSLACLKEYYPAANGLIYDDGNEINGLEIKEGRILLNPSVDHYRVHLVKSDDSTTSTCTDIADQAKAERIRILRRTLEGNEPIGPMPSIINKGTNIPGKKRSKVSDLRRASLPTCIPKIKSIYIGWKHRSNANKKKYVHQKNIKNGTTKEVELDVNQKYSVKQIIEIGISEFKDDVKAKFCLENCNVSLGFFNGVTIDEFSVFGEECGIWKWLNENKILGRINFYLLSTPNEHFKRKYEEALAEGLFNDAVSDGDSDGNQSLRDVTNLETSKVRDSSFIKNLNNSTNNFENLHSSSSSTQNDQKSTNQCDLVNKNNEILKNNVGNVGYENAVVHTEMKNKDKDKSDANKSIEVEAIGIQNDKNDANCQNSISTSDESKKVNEECSSESSQPKNTDIIIVDRCYRFASTSYLDTKISIYTGETMHSELDIHDVYMQEISNNNSTPDFNDFDPALHGHVIHSVKVGDECLITLELSTIGEKVTREYVFGKDVSQIESHSLVYDIDEVLGVNHYYEDNYFIIGIIPKCIQECQPTFTYYRDEQEYLKIPMGFCIKVPWGNESSTWQCGYSCKHKVLEKSKKLKINSDSFKNSNEVQEVTRSQFTISKNCLGSGSTAKVYLGKFGTSDVAVKSIKVYNRYKKLIDREIEVLKQIQHENFIRLYGFCIEDRHVHLLTEYFESCNLDELINSVELKTEYNFDLDRKDSIALQLCQAVSHLHDRINPIIHKDLKAQNVLMNKRGVIKICDFGLSKLSIMVTSLQTTVNSKIMGTKVYMAPELLLKQGEATTNSDVWSLACTILEVYKEDLVWEVESEEELIEKLSNREVPEMTKLPQNFQDVIRRCFSYDHGNRPRVVELVTVWQMNYWAAIRQQQV